MSNLTLLKYFIEFLHNYAFFNKVLPLALQSLYFCFKKVLTIKINTLKKQFRHFFCKYFILTNDLRNLAKKCKNIFL